MGAAQGRTPAGLDGLLARLDGVRQSGPDRWIARCPAHDDRDPSLSVRDAGDRVLIRCHAGCPAEAVVSALGLELRDLFSEALPSGTRRKMAQRHSRRDLLAAIVHEMTVLMISIRDSEREPYATPGPEVIDRERLAAQRLVHLLGLAYPGGQTHV